MADVFPWQRKRNRFLLCALFESQPNYICTRPRHQPTSQGLGRFDLCKSCIISFNWNTIPRARKKSHPRSSHASDFIRGLGNEPFDDRMSSDETGQICKWGVVTWLRKCPLNGFFFRYQLKEDNEPSSNFAQNGSTTKKKANLWITSHAKTRLKNAISTRINVAQRIEFLETAQAIQTAKKNSAEDDFLVMYASHHTAARAHFHAGWLDGCMYVLYEETYMSI